MVFKGSSLSLRMQNDLLLTDSDFHEISAGTVLLCHQATNGARIQYSARPFVSQLPVGCLSLGAKTESIKLICFYPVNLSVGFRIPGSEERRLRIPPLTRKLLHSRGRNVPSPISEIPGIPKG